MDKKQGVGSAAGVPAATPADPNPYTDPGTYKYLAVLIAILIGIGWLGVRPTEDRVTSWLGVLVLLTAFVVVTGRGITGYWRGILIDSRNKMSLSRLQMLAWTLVILSAVLTAALANIETSWDSPMDIEIPSELWVVMGISVTSLIASPAILSNKVTRDATQREVASMERQARTPDETRGLLTYNTAPVQARWSDLLMGEEIGNFAHVDLGKLQMFLFTFILVIGYAAAIGSMFRDPEAVYHGLPKVEQGMNVLLGISHTGYLANKTVAHTQEAHAA